MWRFNALGDSFWRRMSFLIEQVQFFQQRLNLTPLDVADRLWVASHLEPKEEKLRVSS
jgi:hypothetical protein